MKASTLFILLAAAVLAACTTSRQTKKAPFSVTKATVQEQLPGVQGAGISQEYRFKVLVNSDAALVFDSVWVDDKKLALTVVQDGKLLLNAASLKKGDTLTLAASYYKPGEHEIGNETQQAEKVKWPVLANGAALIHYSKNDKSAYYNITTITALPPVILP